MTRQSREYQRLPGRGLHLIGRSTLWLGPDHLLAVESRGYSEDYRRFYYRDIQAIVSVRTSRWLAFAAILGLGLAAVGFSFFKTASDVRPFWAIPAFPLLILFLANLLYGPTCVCRITTAAQTVRLPSLRRIGQARRATSQIRGRVEAEQGNLVDTGLAGSPEPAAEAVSVTVPTAYRVPEPPGLPSRRDTTRLHRVLFWSLIADSLLTVVTLTLKEEGAYIAGATLLVIEFVLAIAAIARQRRTDISKGIRGFVWATLAYLCLSVALIILENSIAVFRAVSSGARVAAGGRNVALDLFGVLAPLFLGTAGLVLVHRFSSDRDEASLSMFSRL